MSALIASLFTILVFIRPQDWWEPLYGVQIVMVTGLIGGLFAITKKGVISNHHTLLLILLCFVGFISQVFNFYFSGAINDFMTLLFSIALPFIIILGLADSRKAKETILFTIIIAAVAIAYNGHTQVVSEYGIGWSGAQILDQHGDLRIRYVGIFSDPNDLGLLFVMTLPLVFYFYSRTNTLMKFIYLLVLLFLLYGVYLTNSRGTLLSVLALCAGYAIKRYGKIAANLMLVGALPLLLVVFSSFRSISASEESAYGRLDAWYAGTQMLKSNPIFGTGLGGFLDNHHLTAHNTYVLCWSELGVVGFLLWFSFLFSIILLLYKVSFDEITIDQNKFEKNKALTIEDFEQYRLMAKTLFYSLCGFAFGVIFLSRLTFVPLYMFCAIGVGVIHQLNNYLDVEYKLTGSIFKRMCLIAFLVLLGINLSLKVLL